MFIIGWTIPNYLNEGKIIFEMHNTAIHMNNLLDAKKNTVAIGNCSKLMCLIYVQQKILNPLNLEPWKDKYWHV